MYPTNNPYIRFALGTLDLLIGIAGGTVAIFCIFWYGRGIYRIVTKRDWFTGIPDNKVIDASSIAA
jgi:hypothetical protein